MAKPLPHNLTMGQVREFAMEHLVEYLGGFVKVGRFLRIRFVYNRNGLPDVPDDMVLGQFIILASKDQAKIIIDDEGGGSAVKPPTPELVE